MDFKGLLDDETLARIDKDAGLQQALALMAASGPSLMPTNLGSILLQGNQVRDQSRQQGLQGAMQRQELLQQRQRQQQMKDIAGMFSPGNAQAALASGGSPTVANAQRMGQPMGPEQAQRALLAAIETGDPKIIEYARSLKDTLMPKQEALFDKIDPSKFEPDSLRRFSQTQDYGDLVAKADEPEAIRTLRLLQQNPDLYNAQVNLKRAGATVIGGFGNDRQLFQGEQDLRKEFKDTPTAKAFNEVKFAYDQVATALKNPSAANDLTAATKFMKILDPGSVVRESELGLAMSATGLFDRISNYYEFLKSGQRLTPSQREDFYRSATQLYNAALDPYVKTREQYQDIAKRYQFDPNRVLGDQAPDRMPVTGIKPVLSPAEAAREELERRRNQK